MTAPHINIVVAVTKKDSAIGNGGKLLFRISDDLKRFKRLTLGRPVIMGRKTYESIGRVLPQRRNIIVTRDHSYNVPGAAVAHSLEEALALADERRYTETQMRTDTGDADARRYRDTQINADEEKEFLYGELTYKLRGVFFAVHNALGPGHKESVYQNALAEALVNAGIPFERERGIEIMFADKKVGMYRPDFIVDKKILIELKALPFLGHLEKKQLWHYLQGSEYKLALLVNFGAGKVEMKRIIYDSARFHQRASASYPRESASPEIFVIGGGDIYKQALPYTDKLYLTIVESDAPGDVFFPDWRTDFTKETLREERIDEKTGLKYTWIDLERKRG